MRLELALLVGIVFFCSWCAYIVARMNSSVSAPGQRTASELATSLAHEPQEAFRAGHLHEPSGAPTYVLRPPADQAPRSQAAAGSQSAWWPPGQPSGGQLAPLPAADYAQTPSSVHAVSAAQQQSLGGAHFSRLAPHNWQLAHLEAPSSNAAQVHEQAAGLQELQFPAARELEPQLPPTDQEQQPAETEPEEAEGVETEAQEPEQDQEGAGGSGGEGEGEDEGGLSSSPEGSQVDEVARRSSVSELVDEERERDRDGRLTVKRRRHLLNGSPVAESASGGQQEESAAAEEPETEVETDEGQPREAHESEFEQEDEPDRKEKESSKDAGGRRAAEELDFERLVEEIDRHARQRKRQQQQAQRKQQQAQRRSSPESGRKLNEETQLVGEEAAHEGPLGAGDEGGPGVLMRRSGGRQLVGETGGELGAKKGQRGASQSSAARAKGAQLGASRKPKEVHEHSLHETLEQQQWDDDSPAAKLDSLAALDSPVAELDSLAAQSPPTQVQRVGRPAEWPPAPRRPLDEEQRRMEALANDLLFSPAQWLDRRRRSAAQPDVPPALQSRPDSFRSSGSVSSTSAGQLAASSEPALVVSSLAAPLERHPLSAMEDINVEIAAAAPAAHNHSTLAAHIYQPAQQQWIMPTGQFPLPVSVSLPSMRGHSQPVGPTSGLTLGKVQRPPKWSHLPSASTKKAKKATKKKRTEREKSASASKYKAAKAYEKRKKMKKKKGECSKARKWLS